MENFKWPAVIFAVVTLVTYVGKTTEFFSNLDGTLNLLERIGIIKPSDPDTTKNITGAPQPATGTTPITIQQPAEEVFAPNYATFVKRGAFFESNDGIIELMNRGIVNDFDSYRTLNKSFDNKGQIDTIWIELFKSH